MRKNYTLTQIRILIVFFMAALAVSGITAIPVEWELSTVLKNISTDSVFYYWLAKVLSAFQNVKQAYPFLLYGYDWLAFAHIVLAILFIGPFRDPVRNVWVIEFGMIACVLIFPLAFIAGHFRGIPFGWQLIDCSFGVIGFIPLWIIHRKIKKLEKQTGDHSFTSHHSLLTPSYPSLQNNLS